MVLIHLLWICSLVTAEEADWFRSLPSIKVSLFFFVNHELLPHTLMGVVNIWNSSFQWKKKNTWYYQQCDVRFWVNFFWALFSFLTSLGVLAKWGIDQDFTMRSFSTKKEWKKERKETLCEEKNCFLRPSLHASLEIWNKARDSCCKHKAKKIWTWLNNKPKFCYRWLTIYVYYIYLFFVFIYGFIYPYII